MLYNDVNLGQDGLQNNDIMPHSGGLKARLQRELKKLKENFYPKATIRIV